MKTIEIYGDLKRSGFPMKCFKKNVEPVSITDEFLSRCAILLSLPVLQQHTFLSAAVGGWEEQFWDTVKESNTVYSLDYKKIDSLDFLKNATFKLGSLSVSVPVKEGDIDRAVYWLKNNFEVVAAVAFSTLFSNNFLEKEWVLPSILEATPLYVEISPDQKKPKVESLERGIDKFKVVTIPLNHGWFQPQLKTIAESCEKALVGLQSNVWKEKDGIYVIYVHPKHQPLWLGSLQYLSEVQQKKLGQYLVLNNWTQSKEFNRKIHKIDTIFKRADNLASFVLITSESVLEQARAKFESFLKYYNVETRPMGFGFSHYRFIESSGGLYEMIKSLGDSEKTVKYLSLSDCLLDDEWLDVLSDIVSKHPSLLELNLSHNLLVSKEVTARIGAWLNENEQLNIDVTSNGLETQEHFKELIRQLPVDKFKRLKWLNPLQTPEWSSWLEGLNDSQFRIHFTQTNCQ